MTAHKGSVSYVLLNEENGTFDTFESEADLFRFVKREGFDADELEDLRVLEVTQEYEITTRPYELVEV